MSDNATAGFPPANARFLTSWSGGKDGFFALCQSKNKGAVPAALVTMLKDDQEMTSAHGLHREILIAQAECLGVPVVFGRAGFGEYEQGLKQAIATASAEFSAESMIFGDIDLDAHRDWYDAILHDFIKTHYPLWHYDRKQLLKDMFRVGVETIIVSIKNDVLDERFLGQTLSADLANEIASFGICPTGEEGDFHTVVVHGPEFKQRLALETTDIWQDGAGHSVLGLKLA